MSYNTEVLSFVGTESRIAKQYKCVITDETCNTVETDPVRQLPADKTNAVP